MVLRKDLRFAIYDELETAMGGIIPPDNISQEYPEQTENFPALVHDDAYRQVPMNIHTGVKNVSTDESGEDTYHYSMVKEGQFTLTIAAQSESVKEQAYDALQEHFETYTLFKDVSEIHPDINRVTLSDVSSDDDDDSEPVTRQDTLSLNVEYERIYDLDVTAVETIEQGVVVTDENGDIKTIKEIT